MATPGPKPAVQPVRPGTPGPKPAVQPVRPGTPGPKPAVQPVRPGTPGPKPAVQPVRPATPGPKPAVQPVRPATPGPKHAVQPVRPATQSSKVGTPGPKPAVQPVRPGTQSPKVATRGSKPAVQPIRSVTHSSKTGISAYKPAVQSVRPAPKYGIRVTRYATRKPIQIGATRRPPATQRSVNVKGCDNDKNIRAKDDETLIGKIAVQNCNCERRFSNNGTRLAAISTTVTTQLQRYFQKLYNTKVNYPITVKVLTGNKTHTIFAYTVKVPKANHEQAREVMKQTCKDEEVGC